MQGTFSLIIGQEVRHHDLFCLTCSSSHEAVVHAGTQFAEENRDASFYLLAPRGVGLCGAADDPY